MINEPGLWEIDAAAYLADPCPVASLNNSTIKPLLECPRLAWEAHPRLNPNYAPHESTRLDLGSVFHALLLGAGRGLQVIDAADYRKQDARDLRDAARLAGKIPVLPDQLATAEAMAQACRDQLKAFDIADPFDLSTGKCELGMFWPEGDIWCRNLIDRLRTDLPAWEVWDVKTCGGNIDPEAAALGIHVVEMGYDTQCAFQERGLSVLFPEIAGRIKFRILFQQIEPPYLISVVEPDAATMTMAHKKVQYAVERWRACMATNRWPGYPTRIMPLRHAEFLANRWLEREIAEHDAGLPPPPAPALKRKPGRPRKEKPSKPIDSLMGG